MDVQAAKVHSTAMEITQNKSAKPKYGFEQYLAGEKAMKILSEELRQQRYEQRQMQSEVTKLQKKLDLDVDAALAAFSLDTNTSGPSKQQDAGPVPRGGCYDQAGLFVNNRSRRRVVRPEKTATLPSPMGPVALRRLPISDHVRKMKSGSGAGVGTSTIPEKTSAEILFAGPRRVATAGITKLASKVHPARLVTVRKPMDDPETRAGIAALVDGLTSAGKHEKLREMRNDIGYPPMDSSHKSDHRVKAEIISLFLPWRSTMAATRAQDDMYTVDSVASLLSGLTSAEKQAKHKEMRRSCGYIDDIDYTSWTDEFLERDMVGFYASWVWIQVRNNQELMAEVKALLKDLDTHQKRVKVREMRASCGLRDLATNKWTEAHIEANVLKNYVRWRAYQERAQAEDALVDFSKMAVKDDDAEMEV